MMFAHFPGLIPSEKCEAIKYYRVKLNQHRPIGELT